MKKGDRIWCTRHQEYGTIDKGFYPLWWVRFDSKPDETVTVAAETMLVCLDASHQKEPDLVNAPPHYTKGQIECLEYILDQNFCYLAGQVIKYVTRYRHKGKAKEDLSKAQFYLTKLIETLPDT